MGNKLLTTLSIILSVIVNLVACRETIAKEQRTVEQIMVDTANEINKTLPRRLNEHTTIDTVVADNRTFWYKCTLINTRKFKFNYKESEEFQGPMLIKNLCTSREIRPMMDKGISYVYIYFDKSGSELIRFKIDSSKCL